MQWEKQSERQPLYIQIQNHFKKLIHSGKLTADDKIPSEKELMEEFRVSRITVANALTQLAKDGWIYRIPGKGSFVDKAIASSTSPSPSTELPPEQMAAVMEELDIRTVAKDAEHSPSQVKRPIGLIIPDIEDFFALRLIQGVNAILKDTEFYLTIALSNHSKELEKEAIVQFVHRGVEGLIIFPIDAETYNDEILSLKVNNFPFVLIDRYLPGVETNFVCSDNRKGTRLAVSHLWELGHREIAICSDTPVQTVTVDERISGYMDTLRQKGAMINPSLILTEFKVNYDDADEQHVLYRYIKNRLATAYITLNGRLGMHIANIARKLNMNIGEDISILTFDNPSPLIDRQGAFTHIAQSESEIGRRSAKILIDILRTPDTRKDYNKVVLEPELVIGKSTGTAPKTAAK